ncbi:MAG: DUF3575 domain-containing protein [Lachnoclostridium sp.]|nr:DUF3575 domain-containing protein [Lachnoclostridium sp.]
MKKQFLRFLLILVAILSPEAVSAQRVALKTNAIDWLLTSANLSVESRLSRRLTLDFGLSGSPFNHTPYGSDIKLRNFRINPELRYWFNRPMARNFLGFAVTGGMFNIRLREHCYKGDLLAAGFTYGYALVLSRHWNVEFTIGVGLAKVHGYDFRYSEGQPASVNMSKWVPVPIRTGVSFSYIFQ